MRHYNASELKEAEAFKQLHYILLLDGDTRRSHATGQTRLFVGLRRAISVCTRPSEASVETRLHETGARCWGGTSAAAFNERAPHPRHVSPAASRSTLLYLFVMTNA